MRAIGDTSKLQSVIFSCRPVPALHHLIRYYYQVETHLAGRTEVQPVPARSPQAIEFTFGAPYEVRRLDRGGTRNAYPIALIGSQTFRPGPVGPVGVIANSLACTSSPNAIAGCPGHNGN